MTRQGRCQEPRGCNSLITILKCWRHWSRLDHVALKRCSSAAQYLFVKVVQGSLDHGSTS